MSVVTLFRVQGAEFRVQGAGFSVQGAGCRVQGFAESADLAGCGPRVLPSIPNSKPQTINTPR